VHSVWSKTLFDRRRAIVWWGLGFVLLATVVTALYPSIKNSPELDRLVERLPAGFRALIGERSLTSPVGYVQSRLFQLIVPLLFLVLAIGQGGDAIAGEERRNTMDLLLANPISRARVVGEKFLALCIQMVILDSVLFVTLWIAFQVFGVAIGVGLLAAALLNVLLFGLAFGAGALAVGGTTGHRGAALGVAAAVAAAAYVWETIAAVVPELTSYAWISPFHHYVASDPLARGFDVAVVVSFASASLVLLAVAIVAFARRDVHS